MAILTLFPSHYDSLFLRPLSSLSLTFPLSTTFLLPLTTSPTSFIPLTNTPSLSTTSLLPLTTSSSPYHLSLPSH